MKKSALFVKGMLGLNLLVVILTIGDFLALHDIQNDYVSTKMLGLHQITTSAPVPAWTAAQGEWQIITISFLARSIFLFANLIMLWLLSKRKIVFV